MIRLANLQSALSLLTESYSAGITPGSVAKASITSEGEMKAPISGAVSPGVPTLNVNYSFNIGDGKVAGSFEASEAGGGPLLSDTFENSFYNEVITDGSMTDQQLTQAVYSNSSILSDTASGDTFQEELAMMRQYDPTTADTIQTALTNGTLQVQNAIDVQGLGFQEGSPNANAFDTFNNDFVNHNPDGKQHALMYVGWAPLYLTW